jgi:hypothetical protein
VTGASDRSDPTVAEILERRKASIKDAPLPPGSPGWDEIRNLRLSEINRRAKRNVRGYKAIRKLLSDRRFAK